MSELNTLSFEYGKSENIFHIIDLLKDSRVPMGIRLLIKVLKATLGNKMKTTIDENGKFNYVSADMRPVPPGIQFCEIY